MADANPRSDSTVQSMSERLRTGSQSRWPNVIGKAYAKSRRPLESEVDFEPPMFVQERNLRPVGDQRSMVDVDRRWSRGALLGVATAIGVLAIVTFLAFFMVPKIPKSEAIDGAISEYRISPSADGARITPEESKKLFEGFVQWRQRQ